VWRSNIRIITVNCKHSYYEGPPQTHAKQRDLTRSYLHEYCTHGESTHIERNPYLFFSISVAAYFCLSACLLLEPKLPNPVLYFPPCTTYGPKTCLKTRTVMFAWGVWEGTLDISLFLSFFDDCRSMKTIRWSVFSPTTTFFVWMNAWKTDLAQKIEI